MHKLTSLSAFLLYPTQIGRRGFSQNSSHPPGRMYPNPPAPASINSSQSRQTTTAANGRNNNRNHNHRHRRHLVGYNNGDESSYSGSGGPSSWPEQTPSFPIQQSSSPPAGFLQCHDIGIASTKGVESYNHNPQVISSHAHKQSWLSSQLIFTNHDSIDHHFSNNINHPKTSTNSTPSSTSHTFTIGPWEGGNSITFDPSSSNPQIDMSEVGTIDNSRIPEDSVAWRIRAKRGCATHPRSIAERERRIRISGKLKKLQELVPNIDKQTSYAELLDLAAQHIEGLQCQLQKLDKELGSCTCGCKHKN